MTSGQILRHLYPSQPRQGGRSFSGQIPTPTETITGNKVLQVRATLDDQAGNSDTVTKISTFKFDNSGPSIEFTPPSSSSWVKTQTTEVKIADKGESGLKSGASKYVWNQISDEKQMTKEKIDQALSDTGGKLTLKDQTGSNWYLWVYAEDNLGNPTIKKAGAFYIDNANPDTTAPGTEATTHSITITLRQTDADSQVNPKQRQYRWKLSTDPDTKYSAWTTVDAATCTFTEKDGIAMNQTYTVQTQVTDIAGNGPVPSTTANVTTKDIKMPTYSADATGWVNRDVKVTITFPETTGASLTKEWSYDKNTWNKVTSGTTATATLTPTQQTVYARQYEINTNTTSAANSYSYTTIDEEPPKITSAVANADKTITITAEDTGGSGIAGYTLTTEKESVPGEFTPQTTSPWISPAQQPGMYYAWVQDGAKSVSEPVEVKVRNPYGKPDKDGFFTENSTVNGDKPGANDPTVPAGFKPFEDDYTADAKWTDDPDGGPSAESVKQGLVVQDKNGSEFVWIPVPDINKMVMCKQNTGSSICKLKLENNQLICSIHGGSPDICGRLYRGTNSPTYTETNQTYAQNSSYREVDLVTNFDGNERCFGLLGFEDSTDFLEQMNSDFKKMAVSVAKHGGFYIGRYELSLEGSTDKNASSDGRGQCKKNVYATDASNSGTLKWYGLYKKERDFASDWGYTSFGSSMVWGCQYDAMLTWMHNNGIRDHSSTPTDVTGGDPKSRNSNADITGYTENDKLCNVYDLLGCNWEWSLEAYAANFRVWRGSSHSGDGNFGIASTGGQPPWDNLNTFSSRPTLYLTAGPGEPDDDGYFTENSTVNGLEGKAENPTVPAGFKPLEDDTTADAQWRDGDNRGPSAESLKQGLVIQDKNGSEFVWVPVPDINKMVMCKQNSGTSVCKLELQGGNLVCTTHGGSTDLCGRLYTTSNATYDSTLQTFSSDSDIREPDLVTNYDQKQTYLDQLGLSSSSDFLNQMNADFKKMAVSVAKYGGFYIGRYELSLEGATNSDTPSNGRGQCKKGVYAANGDNGGTKYWYGLYKKERDFASDWNYSSLESSMVWGCQYDAMLAWMYGNDVDVYNRTPIDVTGDRRYRDSSNVAGHSENDKLCNVYGLLGCRDEYTLEAHSNSQRVIRAKYTGRETAYDRSYREPDMALSSLGSRPTLFLLSEPGAPDEDGFYTENSTVNGLEGKAENPTIPAGFKPFEDDTTAEAHWTDGTDNGPSANSLKHGLVIQDKNGSEFVWIPVPDINKMIMCKRNNENSDGSVCKLELQGDQLICKTHSDNSDLCGRLYYAGSTYKYTGSYTETDQLYVKMQFDQTLGEPCSSGSADFLDEMNSNFKKMAVSVAKYGGFYIGRYQLSLEGIGGVDYSASGRGVCVDTDYPLTAMYDETYGWGGLYKKERNFASEWNYTSIGSSMVWGCQWDAMMAWMYGNGVNVSSTTPTDVTNGSVSGKLCNVCDLSGFSDWTLEGDSGDDYRCLRSGAGYPKNSRFVDDTYWRDYQIYSSRPTLYLE